ncbi:endonuclease/exonuclease/phosphatase family protein, partial [Clostridium perfringens]|uniref:endonuclease/exonuclease/phosphatase family protein n=1 Tax=Clostridium perfringens TaxID=1502 RepID=UPI001A7E7B22
EENQANAIAEILDYHVVFCPTVIHGAEQYGHAILSRYPIETVKVAELPSFKGGIWPEKRGALWTRVEIETLAVNIVTTHFGLS